MSQRNYLAFQKSLPLLERIPLDKYVKILIIKVISCKNLKSDEVIEFHPVVNLMLKGENSQKQRTSVRYSTNNPLWDPVEVFYFILENLENPIIISVVSRNSSETYSLGLTQLALSNVTDIPTYLHLPLTLANGKISDSEIVVEVSFSDVANVHVTQTIHEFERYQPITGWGHNFLPTDPGRWSNANRNAFFKTLDDAERELIEGWDVLEGWGPSIGWLYATFFTDITWYGTASLTTYVRRRSWTRIVRPSSAVFGNLPRPENITLLSTTENTSQVQNGNEQLPLPPNPNSNQTSNSTLPSPPSV